LENKTINSIRHKEENILIWNLIGPVICQYYQKSIKNCKITYTMADNQSKRMGSIENIMYILVIDSSGSMMGKNWTDVL
jgi:Mg-chelatase subunit ChlD